ncbi:MAG: adenine deaminase C-terminal domain-containing protein [Candidatus Caldarchaeum sp.]|nr:adenine deaminase C-terminal domain-containing protein [Candidatus Caldarchaeum sp.]
MLNEIFLNSVVKGVKADTIIENGNLVNVCTEEIYKADIAIFGDRILALHDAKEFMGAGTKIIDASSHYLVPGLIDGHLHVECSKLSLTMFAKLVLPYGTTSIVSGLDQIYVVCGLRGVKEFLKEAERSPLKLFWGAPSKLPYTIPPSTVGHKFGPKQHRYAQRIERCVGVWETVKEFILERDPDVLSAIKLAAKNRLPVYGCAPMADDRQLTIITAAGLRADHESYSAAETLKKMRLGLHVMLRESSVAHLLKENVKAITEYGASPRRVAFCTDDVIASDVISRGHLDNLVRTAIAEGLDPLKAIQLATINCAEIYRIDHLVGCIAPGRYADILIVENLEKFRVNKVIANGVLVASEGKMLVELRPPKRQRWIKKTIKRRPVLPREFKLRTDVKTDKVKVLAMKISEEIPFIRTGMHLTLPVKNGEVQATPSHGVNYIAVVDRYHERGRVAVALVSGFNIEVGAIASSTAPDDNNIICIGSDPADMTEAVNHVIRNQGGQVVVKEGQVIEFLKLPLAGIVADIEPHEMARKETMLDDVARQLGCRLPSPFMYMIFFSITAIPEYAITDRGLVESKTMRVINPIIGPA